MFAKGEQVWIDAPGWIWDRHIADVLAYDPPDELHEAAYVVRIKWPDGPERRYTFWASQLHKVEAPTE